MPLEASDWLTVVAPVDVCKTLNTKKEKENIDQEGLVDVVSATKMGEAHCDPGGWGWSLITVSVVTPSF